jgi:beta-lactamase regulating signal transducer with metallopeptidase domain
MISLGNIFYIVIFVSIIGSVFSMLTLFAKKVLHIVIPLWSGVCGIGFFCLPVILPWLWLVSPEEPSWANGYKVACQIWLIGVITLSVCYMIRAILAYNILNKYRLCDDEHINRIYNDCMSISNLKKIPKLYFGSLNEPACVITFFRPAIILKEAIVKQLTDKELEIVLCHELAHISRRHPIYQRIYYIVNILHWFNLFAWISKNDFIELCEIDCDQKALSMMNGKVTEIEYATALLHLLELSSKHRRNKAAGMRALGFLFAKQRMNFILKEPTKGWHMICTMVFVLLIALTVLLSVNLSRSYFYPYPAYHSELELSYPDVY